MARISSGPSVAKAFGANMAWWPCISDACARPKGQHDLEASSGRCQLLPYLFTTAADGGGQHEHGGIPPAGA
jgi:hypothetical protein